MAKKDDITSTIVDKATEVVFVYDTTGSMQPCIANVRKHIEKTCEELFKDIPNLRVGFIAHGDYCDGPNCYKLQDLTDDQAKVYDFIRSAPNTSGGDEPECYELALNLVKSFGWSKAKGGKVVVMIGDAYPHPVNYPDNKDKLDWRKELNDLKEMGINVYPLQCLYSAHQRVANEFWAEIGNVMGTPLLKLDDFNEAALAMRSYAHASGGSATYHEYEKKLASSGVELSGGIKAMNAVLRDEAVKYDVIEEIGTPVGEIVKSEPAKTEPKKRRGRPKKVK